MAAEHFAHLLLARIGIDLEKRGDRHQDAGRAVAALQAMVLAEGELDVVELALRASQALDGVDAAALDLNRRFGNWYYVISGDSYAKLQISRKDLLKK